MTESSNEQRLVDCFANALGLKPVEISDALTYNSIREWDSIGHMTLMTELETVFDVMLDTEDIINLSSIAQARNILMKHGVSF